jgi:hypothetical protein
MVVGYDYQLIVNKFTYPNISKQLKLILIIDPYIEIIYNHPFYINKADMSFIFFPLSAGYGMSLSNNQWSVSGWALD